MRIEGMGFPGGTRGKESTCQSRRQKRCAFDAWVRNGQEDPLEWEMAPTPVFLPEKFRGQRNLVGYSPLVCKDLDTTEQLSTHTHKVLWASLVAHRVKNQSVTQ